MSKYLYKAADTDDIPWNMLPSKSCYHTFHALCHKVSFFFFFWQEKAKKRKGKTIIAKETTKQPAIPDWCQDPVWALPSWFCDWTGHFRVLGDSSLCGFFLSSLSHSYIWKALWTSIKRGTRSLTLHYLAIRFKDF